MYITALIAAVLYNIAGVQFISSVAQRGWGHFCDVPVHCEFNQMALTILSNALELSIEALQYPFLIPYFRSFTAMVRNIEGALFTVE